MKVKFNGRTLDILAVQMENHIVTMIDQRWLPFKFELKQCVSWKDTVNAIKDLVTRGAGSIGVSGGFALAQAAQEISATSVDKFTKELRKAADVIKQARPTAANLSAAIDYCLQTIDPGTTVDEKRVLIDLAAHQILELDMQASREISKTGAALLKNGSRVLTHCNAGALGIQDYGSALGILRFAHEAGNLAMVYVSETRPWLQGSRLTSWELHQENIPHRLVVDSASGYLFNQGLVDAVIVGADRIVANGDVANKIGTYEKALLAHVHQVPFYVAAPIATFDLDCPSGDQIIIEQRSAQEVRTVIGRLPTGEIGPVQVALEQIDVLNPVFDITPAKYVTGFITEKGVLTKINRKKILQLIKKSGYSSQEKGI